MNIPSPIPQGLSGREAFNAHISTLQAKGEDGNCEIWFKQGDTNLFVGNFNQSGRFTIRATIGQGKDRKRLQPVGTAWNYLSQLCQEQDGGVTYISTQPIGFPLAGCVTETDDIGIEMDSLSVEDQWTKYEEFRRITGLNYATRLTSGGKSIHAHLKAFEHLPLEQANYLRRLAIIGFMSDPVTERLHQPMRFAGFFRKEKGTEQRLLSHSSDRYTYEELVEGFHLWFTYQGWAVPETISDIWWKEVLHPIFPNHKGHGEAEKAALVKAALEVGQAGYEAAKAQAEAERQQRREERKQRLQTEGRSEDTSLTDLVKETCDRLGKDAFDQYSHNWQFEPSGQHARGRCYWHDSTSGNSAYISGKKGTWGYVCPACTHEKRIDAFTYWRYATYGKGAPFPRGKDYVDQAKAFLSTHGVEPPAWQPLKPPLYANKKEQQNRKTKAEQFKDEVDYWQGWLNRLDLEPTIAITDRYLPAGILPGPRSILLVDAPMNTGKTSSYGKGLLDHQSAIAPDGKFIMLGGRNLLQFQTMKAYSGKHHSQYDSVTAMQNDRWWVGCYDSIFKFDPARITEGSILFLDEISSGFKHLLVGSTLKDMRVFAIRRLAEICRVVIRKGGWIVGSVDNLTNVELALLQDIVGVDVPVSLTQSKWKGEPWEITIFDSSSQTWGQLHEHFADSLMYEDAESKPIIAASDSAKWLRDTERFVVEEVGLPQEKVWILDADSSPEPWAKAFADDPDQWIATNQPLFFGYSPSLENGASITAKHEDGSPYFAAMAVHLIGVLEPRDAVQLPARYRLPVPRFGYIKEFATKDDGCRSLHPDVILRDLRRTTKGIALFTQIADQVAKEQTTITGENAPDLAGTLTRLLSDDADNEETFWLKHYARIVARENGGKARLQADMIERWEAKGHQVSLQLLGADKALSKCRQRIHEALDSEETTAFANANISCMTVEEARAILDRFGATKEDRRRAKKRLLVERLPGCPLDTVEFVHKAIVHDYGKFLKSAELLWAYQHPDWQQQIDSLNLFGKVKRAATRNEWVYAGDLRSRGYQADLMARSPLHDCLNDAWYGDDSPQVVKFKAWALWNRAEISTRLRLNVHEDQSGTAILNKFVRKLGFELADKRPGKRGEARPRLYRIKNLEDYDREAILTALTAKFQASAPPVSNICTIKNTLQNLDTDPPEEHSEDDLWTAEAELDNFKSIWETDDSPEARRELLKVMLKVMPLTVLERAVPSDELRRAAA